jgi:hypothetical protein
VALFGCHWIQEIDMRLNKLYGIWQVESCLPFPGSARDGAIKISLIDIVGGGMIGKMKELGVNLC